MENLPAEVPESLSSEPLTIGGLIEQVELIAEMQQRVMLPKIHYGVIPGTEKPTLLKPGAEKLCVLFRMAPKITTQDIQRFEYPNGHREYEITVSMYSIATGKFLGSGVGESCTMESKHRYRYKSYQCPTCGMETIIKGKEEYGGGWLCFKKKGGCGEKFKDTDPKIVDQKLGRIENPDPADCYNTVKKMAKKRALIDAVLTITATSDIFTQDIEDVPAESPSSEQKKPEKSGVPLIKEKKQSLKKKDERSASKLKELQEKLREAASVEKDAMDHGEEKPNILRSMWKSMYEESQKDLTLADFRMLEKLKDELKKDIDESGESKEPEQSSAFPEE